MKTIRLKNLHLLRYVFDTQANVVNMMFPGDGKMHGVIERQAQGKTLISEADARLYEQKLALPQGWMDRDHDRLLKLTNEETEVVFAVLAVIDSYKR